MRTVVIERHLRSERTIDGRLAPTARYHLPVGEPREGQVAEREPFERSGGRALGEDRVATWNRRAGPARARRAREWIVVLALCAAFSAGIRTAVVEAYWIPSGSMRPTLEAGDRLLGAKFAYWIGEPHRGDIAVFTPPPEAATAAPRLIKRIVAVAGDQVEIRGGRLLVNGAPVREPYLAEPPEYAFGPLDVPPGHVFVLGDNRNDSLDGHVWGLLPVDHLRAKALFRFWPPGRVGRLE